LERELDVEPDGAGAGVARAAVRGLHDPGAAAGDHREPTLAEATPDVARERVAGVIRTDPRGAEDRDAAGDVGKRLEALGELVVEAREALVLGLLGGDDGRLGAEQFLVGGRGGTDAG